MYVPFKDVGVVVVVVVKRQAEFWWSADESVEATYFRAVGTTQRSTLQQTFKNGTVQYNDV
jgi:hypothetical protein